jgi:hypothetical protein
MQGDQINIIVVVVFVASACSNPSTTAAPGANQAGNLGTATAVVVADPAPSRHD